MLTSDSLIAHETLAAWLDKGRLRHTGASAPVLGLGRSVRRFLDEKGAGK